MCDSEHYVYLCSHTKTPPSTPGVDCDMQDTLLEEPRWERAMQDTPTRYFVDPKPHKAEREPVMEYGGYWLP